MSLFASIWAAAGILYGFTRPADERLAYFAYSLWIMGIGSAKPENSILLDLAAMAATIAAIFLALQLRDRRAGR